MDVLKSRNGASRWLVILLFAPLLLFSFGMFEQNAFAMGQSPSVCNNRYDGPITVAKINNGTQTFDALTTTPTFQLSPKGTYYLLFIVHTPSQDANGNSDPGTVWTNTDLNGFAEGACNGGADPNQNYTIGFSWACFDNRCDPSTWWSTNVNGFSYDTDFVTSNNTNTNSTIVPNMPTNITPISVSTSQIDLMWNAPTNSSVSGYKIERSTDGGTTWFTIASNTNSTITRYFDSGLQQYSTYYYRISAINSVGTSFPSTTAFATTQAPVDTAPQPPTGLTANTVSSQIDLNWTAPSNNGGLSITNYKVYRGSSSGSETLLTEIGNVTSYNDTSATRGQTSFYKVTSVNSVGQSSPSNEASAMISGPPQSPTGLAATAVSSSQINLSWTAPSNNGGSTITGYMIERSNNTGTTWSTIQSNTGSTSTTYNDTSLVASTAYTYRVSAINSVGTSSPSNTASATTSANAPPPTGITLNNVQKTSGTVSSSPYQMTLSNFNAGTGSNNLLVVGTSANNAAVTSVTFGGVQLTQKISSFSNNDAEFWYLKNPSGTGNIVVTMGGSTSVVVGAYSFSGVNETNPIPTSTASHNSAVGSPKISITTQYANSWVLDLPSIYGGVTLGSPTCTQQWNTNIPSAITGASSSALVQSPGSATCSWTASGGGDMWDDVAVEIKSSGTSSGGTTTVPSSPTGLAATAGNAQVSLSWSTPSSNGGSSITGYDIYRGTASGSESSTPIATGVTSTTYTDSGLTNGQAYYYKVTAVNSVGQSPQSNEASATPTAPPPAGVTVQSIDQNNKPIYGILTFLCSQGTSNNANGTTTCATGESRINSGYTTVTFNEPSGDTLGVEVEDSKNCTFNHWTDNGNDRFRLFTAQSPPPTLTAAFSCVAANSTAPSAPQNLQATGGNAKVSLSWTAPSSNGGSAITGYSVYRGTASGGESTTPIATGIASTSYSDTSVTNGITYYYDIKAVNSVGTSSPSNEASAMPAAPPTPTGIVLNNVQSTSGATTSNQMTLSGFNAGSGSNQLLVVGVSANNAAVTSVTFGGVKLTRAVSSFNNNDAEFWYLKNPSGTGNVLVTMSGSTSAVVGAYSFSGVNQTTSIATTTSNHNTASGSPSISMTTKYANDWVLDLPSIYGGVTLGSPTCTQQWDTNIAGAITGASSSTTVSSPGSVTCKWTASNGGDLWDDVAVEIKASG